MLSFDQARETILQKVRREPAFPKADKDASDVENVENGENVEIVPLEASLNRVLAAAVSADRDYPPFDRSTRDGFAVRSSDVATVPSSLHIAGEVRAGQSFDRTVNPGECVRIMTGAPVPPGADAVVMVEFTETRGDTVTINRTVSPGANIVPRGSEARQGDTQLSVGDLIGYPEIAALGQVGRVSVPVYRRPRVAVLSTGDEVVLASETPGAVQIRNSNSFSLGAQVALAGGEPVLLGTARDEEKELEEYLRKGLQEDLLVITGGISMGKYDLVEGVLRKLGAEFFFDAVAIRPGRPAVFGRCREKFVFGLPGNPLSTMVTFELFVAPAIALLGGTEAPPLRYHMARLEEAVNQTTDLTLFIPASLERKNSEVWVQPLPWKGSGDVSGLAKSDCFLMVPGDVEGLEAGSWVSVLMRLGSR